MIVEVSDKMPYVYGGNDEAVHISDIDLIVESDNQPLVQVPSAEPTAVDSQVGEHVMEHLEDGSVIQLGVGGMPNAIGGMIAQSDLKDLGGYTEMLVDAYVDMYEAGVMTGKQKAFDRGRIAFPSPLGLSGCTSGWTATGRSPATTPTTPTTRRSSPGTTTWCRSPTPSRSTCTARWPPSRWYRARSAATAECWISCTEPSIPGGGKSFICLASVRESKAGQRVSRIVPALDPGTIVTVPRTMTNYVVAEYGAVDLKAGPPGSGRNCWSASPIPISETT